MVRQWNNYESDWTLGWSGWAWVGISSLVFSTWEESKQTRNKNHLGASICVLSRLLWVYRGIFMGMRKRFDNDDMMRLSFSFHESDLLCLIVLEISLNLSRFSSGDIPTSTPCGCFVGPL